MRYGLLQGGAIYTTGTTSTGLGGHGWPRVSLALVPAGRPRRTGGAKKQVTARCFSAASDFLARRGMGGARGAGAFQRKRQWLTTELEWTHVPSRCGGRGGNLHESIKKLFRYVPRYIV